MVWIMLLLGLVQGLTEFLPVSSSGHLTLFSGLFGKLTKAQTLSAELAVHVGSSIAVMVIYRKKIFSMLKKGNRKYIFYLILASIPAGIVGVLFHAQLESLFGGGSVGFGFLFTAVLLLITQTMARQQTGESLSYKTALSMGLMQAVAIIPGLSRSGSTVFGGTLAGGNREEVADFSFLMSVPVILGGALYQCLFHGGGGLSFPLLGLGVVSAFFASFVALNLMKRVIARARYTGFIVYLTALGVATLLFRFAI
ncbi:MAG: undecaprenyl-diphosphate phosphatase [Clostridiales bacterium]|nr:undecaprenyl-diphosphate phosphatase [Clostridiales bacterium]